MLKWIRAVAIAGTLGLRGKNSGVFTLIELAHLCWRRLNGFDLLPLVRTGVPFKNGARVERDDQMTEQQPAEIAA